MLGGLLRRCRFPTADSPVVCAVSGGADSLALMILARAAGYAVLAVHVDHGLREGSAAEADAVAVVAARFGAEFEARRVSVLPGPDLEARARRARYDSLPPGVLTGHTADDQAETVLLNLLRGAGLDGLAGMASTARVGRPLLGLRRAETIRLCASVGVDPFVDPSNRDDRYRRNRVRHELLPLLAEISGRDPVPILGRQAALMADEAAWLDGEARQLDATDAHCLDQAPLVLSRRALRLWLRTGSGPEMHPPSSAEVDRVLTVARGEVVACELSGGRRVSRSRGRLQVSPPESG